MGTLRLTYHDGTVEDIHHTAEARLQIAPGNNPAFSAVGLVSAEWDPADPPDEPVEESVDEPKKPAAKKTAKK